MDWYDRAGFLYPAKRERLAPVLPAAVDAWERSLTLGEAVRRTCTYEDRDRWAAMDQWRSAAGTWSVQHLVSNGGGAGSRATILGGLAYGLDDPGARAWNCWFRMNNPMPRRVLGTSADAVGPRYSSLTHHEILRVPLTVGPATGVGITEVGAGDLTAGGVLGLIRALRGSVFVAAEELDTADPLLDGLDAVYRAVGLTRRRHILAAHLPGNVEPAGVALVHRGPLATNFSFLENRCDLLVAPGLDDDARRRVVRGLTSAATHYYRSDSPPPFIPVVTDRDVAPILLEAGAARIQSYAHVIWLRAGLPALHEHVEACFATLRARR